MIDPRINIDNTNAYGCDDDWSRLRQIHFAHRPETDDALDRLADLAVQK